MLHSFSCSQCWFLKRYKQEKHSSKAPSASLRLHVFLLALCWLTVFWLAKLWDHLSVIIVLTTVWATEARMETKRKIAHILVCVVTFFLFIPRWFLLWFLFSVFWRPSAVTEVHTEAQTAVCEHRLVSWWDGTLRQRHAPVQPSTSPVNPYSVLACVGTDTLCFRDCALDSWTLYILHLLLHCSTTRFGLNHLPCWHLQLV